MSNPKYILLLVAFLYQLQAKAQNSENTSASSFKGENKPAYNSLLFGCIAIGWSKSGALLPIAHVSLTKSISNNYYSIRYVEAKEIFFGKSGTKYFVITYGKRITSLEYSNIVVSVGPSVATNTKYVSGGGLFSYSDPVYDVKYNLIGLHTEINFCGEGELVGIGIRIFSNINSERAIFGVLFYVNLGKLY